VVNNFPSEALDYATGPQASSIYLPSGVSCSQSYTYSMDDYSSNPSSLTIDSDTGVLSLTNTANVKQSYDI
jgi:hypothetical protein